MKHLDNKRQQREWIFGMLGIILILGPSIGAVVGETWIISLIIYSIPIGVGIFLVYFSLRLENIFDEMRQLNQTIEDILGGPGDKFVSMEDINRLRRTLRLSD